MGESETRQLLEAALRAEIVRSGRSAARIRLAGAIALTAVATLAAELTQQESWRVYVAPLVAYTAFAGLVRWMVARTEHPWPAEWATLLDLGVVFLCQWRTMPISPLPGGVAGFSGALFALVLVMDSASLPKVAILPLAGVAAALDWVLVTAGGGDVASRVAAVLVLLLVGASMFLNRRMREELTFRFAAAEVQRERTVADAARADEERRESEARLEAERRRNDALVRLQSDKDTLTQFLVHDLRAPLSVISGYLELIDSNAGRPGREERIKSAVAEALGTTERLTRMIADILDVQKLEDGRLLAHREPIDLAAVVGRVARSVQRASQRHVIEVDVAAAKLDGDSALLARVVENLLSNAQRYTPEGARIRVTTGIESGDAIVRVMNEGTPISDELRTRLFSKFGQEKGARHGYGLGLYFARLAAEGHGGRIRLVDDTGWPVVFEVRIPGPKLTPAPPERIPA